MVFVDCSYRNYPLAVAKTGISTLPADRRGIADYWLALLAEYDVPEEEAIPMAFQKALRARFSGYPHWSGAWVPTDRVDPHAACASHSKGKAGEPEDLEGSQGSLF